MIAQITWLANVRDQKQRVQVVRKSTQTKTPSKTSGPGTNYVIRDNSHINIKGGSCCVQVNMEGVPITGVIDTGSDITILRARRCVLQHSFKV